MKKYLLAGAIIALGAPILASAQCVAPKNPTNDLVGQTYAFSVTGTRIGAIGQFTVLAGGYLNITETVVDTSGSTTNVINRLAPAWGRWLSNATCNGGQLQFMLNREFFTLNYTKGVGPAPGLQPILVLSGNDEWYLNGLVPVQKYVLTGCVGPAGRLTTAPPAAPPSCNAITGPSPWGPPPFAGALAGTAWLSPPKACPAGLGNPVNLLKGVSLQVTSFGLPTTWTFSFTNPNAYAGDITITFNNPATAPVTYPLLGRYIMYPDCSGGEFLIYGLRPGFGQFEFIWIDSTFTRFVSLADALL